MENSLIIANNRDNSQLGSLSNNFNLFRRNLYSSSTTKHRSSMTLSTQISSPAERTFTFGNHLETPKNANINAPILDLGQSESGLHRSLQVEPTQSILHGINMSRRNSHQPISRNSPITEAAQARISLQQTSTYNFDSQNYKMRNKSVLIADNNLYEKIKRILKKPLENLKNTANRYSFQYNYNNYYQAPSSLQFSRYQRQISGKNTTSMISGPVSPTSLPRPNYLRSVSSSNNCKLEMKKMPKTPESDFIRFSTTRSSTLETNTEIRGTKNDN